MSESTLISVVIGIVVSVVGWLLKNKDAQQEKQLHELREDAQKQTEMLRDSIKLLFIKHDDDAAKLRDLELDIARRHYVKEELDVKFDRLEIAFRDGLNQLGLKFDKLSEILIDHVRKEDAK